ncbi:GNAL isoform 10, partial [Pongo abelii]
TNKICWQKKSWQGNQKLKTISQNMQIILFLKTEHQGEAPPLADSQGHLPSRGC